MPRWEMCRIQNDEVRSERIGGFLSSATRHFYRFVAVVITPQGARVIDQTAPYEWIEWDQSHENAEWRARTLEGYERGGQEKTKLIGRLLADGWEPIQAEDNDVTLFKRVVTGT
jgi:hypothetical protein